VARFWRDLDAERRYCHSCHDLRADRLSAMDTSLLLILIALIAWWAVRLVLTVRRDGLGTRRPPASHHDWTEGSDPLRHR
jgi:hypothetical protein